MGVYLKMGQVNTSDLSEQITYYFQDSAKHSARLCMTSKIVNVNEAQQILENVKLIVQTVTVSVLTNSSFGRKFPSKIHTSPRFLEKT